MLGQTPPMGWNSWNTFGSNINEKLIMEIADAKVTLIIFQIINVPGSEQRCIFVFMPV